MPQEFNTNISLRRPEDDNGFQMLCRELYKLVYADPNLSIVGRDGQDQFGTDLIGHDNRTKPSTPIGIQCKNYIKKKFTFSTIESDVKKAGEGNLEIAHLHFTTTAYRDAAVSLKTNKLNSERKAKGLFTVSVDFWEDIEFLINRHPCIGREFITDYPGGNLHELNSLATQIDSTTKQTNTMLNSLKDDFARDIKGVRDLLLQNFVSEQNAAKPNASDETFSNFIDIAKILLDGGKVTDAESALRKIGNPEALPTKFLKYRWHTNMAAIHLINGNSKSASSEYIKAYEYAPDNEKACANHVLAHFLEDNLAIAEEYCANSIRLFPESPLIWSLKVQIDTLRGREVDLDNVPAIVKGSDEFIFGLSRSLSRKGEYVDSMKLLAGLLRNKKDCLTTKRVFMADALQAATNSNTIHSWRQIAANTKDNLKFATELFQPIAASLADIQSDSILDELATNLSSAYMLLNEHERASELARMMRTKLPDNSQLFRITISDMVESKDAKAIREYFCIHKDKTTIEQLLIFATAFSFCGEVDLLSETIEIASAKAEWNEYSEDFITKKALAVFNSGRPEDATMIANTYVEQNSQSTVGKVALARIFLLNGMPDRAKVVLSLIMPELLTRETDHITLDAANILCSAKSYENAAAMLAKFVTHPQNDDITLRWLTCLSFLNERRKILNVLDTIPADQRSSPLLRSIEVDIHARMENFGKIEQILEEDLKTAELSPHLKFSLGFALQRLGKTDKLKKYLSNYPASGSNDVDHITNYAKLHLLAGDIQTGIQQLYDVYKKNPNNVSAASNLYAALLTSPRTQHLDSADSIIQGKAYKIKSGTSEWWVAVDYSPSTNLGTWPEVIHKDNPTAALLSQQGLNTPFILSFNFAQLECQITKTLTMLEFALMKANELLSSPLNSSGPVWSVKFEDSNGNPDFTTLLAMVSKKKAATTELFNLYNKNRLPAHWLADRLGLNPANLLLDWPKNEMQLFIWSGSTDENENNKSILATKSKPFVTDIFTLAELSRRRGGLKVLKSLGRPYVPSSHRQSLIDYLAMPTIGEKDAVLFESGGKLAYRELPPSHKQNRDLFLRHLIDVIDNYCDVTSSAGPELKPPELTALENILDPLSLDVLLLCLEKDAVMLSEDGGLRLFGSHCGVSATLTCQAVYQFSHENKIASTIDYAYFMTAKILDNHFFVSISSDALFEIARQTPTKQNNAVITMISSLQSPFLDLKTGIRVCFRFLTLCARYISAAATASYLCFAFNSLIQGGRVKPETLKRIFAIPMRLYGRNGRKLPLKTRSMFMGVLDRKYRR